MHHISTETPPGKGVIRFFVCESIPSKNLTFYHVDKVTETSLGRGFWLVEMSTFSHTQKFIRGRCKNYFVAGANGRKLSAKGSNAR